MSRGTLADLIPDTPAVVEALDLEFALRERLFALGLRVGRTLRVVRRISRGGPLQVRIDHTDLILRGSEAAKIQVAPLAAAGQPAIASVATDSRSGCAAQVGVR